LDSIRWRAGLDPSVSPFSPDLVGGIIAIIVGLVGIGLYRNIGKVEVGVSVLSIILGIIFILEAPGLFYSELQPHALAMQAIGALMVLLVGVGAAFLPEKTTAVRKA